MVNKGAVLDLLYPEYLTIPAHLIAFECSSFWQSKKPRSPDLRSDLYFDILTNVDATVPMAAARRLDLLQPRLRGKWP